MKKHINPQEFASLLSYYYECLQQEQLLSLVLEPSNKGRQYVLLPFTTEPFSSTTPLHIPSSHTAAVKHFVHRQTIDTSTTQLYYGFPVFSDSKENLFPLIMMPASLEIKEKSIELQHTAQQPELNTAILFQYGFEIEEINELRTIFDPSDIQSTIQHMSDILTLPAVSSASETVEHPKKPNILSQGILFFVEKTSFTQSLLIELQKLKKIPFHFCEESALNVLINPLEQQKSEKINHDYLLEIYPLNPAQEQSVRHALTKPFTVITGPPGTGKSQVVLNIIANAVWSGKSVLFASKNNKAVDVVTEKLKPLLSLPVVMRMGSEQYRRQTRNNIPLLFQEKLSLISENQVKNIHTELQKVVAEIKQYQKKLNEMSLLNKTVDMLQSNITTKVQCIPPQILNQYRTEILQNFSNKKFQEVLKKLQNHRYKSWICVIQKLFSKKIYSRRYTSFKRLQLHFSSTLQEYIQAEIDKGTVTPPQILLWIQAIYQSILDQKDIENINHKLLTFPPVEQLRKQIFELQQKKIHYSRKLLNNNWCSKVMSAPLEHKKAVQDFFDIGFELQNFINDPTLWKKLDMQWKKNLMQILPFLPVWITTNLSVKNSIPFKNNLFDLVIIDEASQCDIASALPLLFRAKQAVIIGDPQQLRHISLLHETLDTKIAMANQINVLHQDFSYVRRSLYDLAETVALERHDPPILLNEHYRCHRDIITFSNNYFYKKKLAILTREDSLITHRYGDHGVIWYDVPGKTIRKHSSYNLEEINFVVRLIQKLQQTRNEKPVSLGVVTLFRTHMELIEEKIKMLNPEESIPVTVGTAHRFQGDEKDIIIFSPAVSTGVYPGTIQWIQTTRQLINVAISRAKSLLIITGDHTTCRQTQGILRDLAYYVKTVQHQTVTDFTSPAKQILYETARANGLYLLPQYRIHRSDHTVYEVDFVLFTGNTKYIILVKDQLANVSDENILRADDWRIRQYTTSDINADLSAVIESLKRLC